LVPCPIVTHKMILRFCRASNRNSTALLNTVLAPDVEGFDIRSNVEDCLRQIGPFLG
jgi:hypothetical protein